MLGYPQQFVHPQSSSSHRYVSTQPHESVSHTGLGLGLNSINSDQVRFSKIQINIFINNINFKKSIDALNLLATAVYPVFHLVLSPLRF